MKKEVKVAIIGAGTAGRTARKIISKTTDNYVVIEGGIHGTTCARVGCMPSKALIQIADEFHQLKQLACLFAIFVPFRIVEVFLLYATGSKVSHGAVWNWVQEAGDKAIMKLKEELEKLRKG